MSSASPSSALPENVIFFPDAADDFRGLDGAQQLVVIKALRKIASAPNDYGKPLGSQSGRNLTGLRSAYVARKSTRIVWLVTENGDVQIVLVAGIAKREDRFIYELVASRRHALNRFIHKLKT